MKRIFVVVFLVSLIFGLMAGPASARGKPEYGCAPGFAPYTSEEALALPRTVAGLDSGLYDVDFVVSVFESVDHNGDGIVCFQDVGALNGEAHNWAYLYNLVDNNASVPH